MSSPSRPPAWLGALALAVFEVGGSFGAAGNQPDRRGIDALALALVLVGPAAIALRRRWPLAGAVATLAATDAYLAAGYPYGPIFAGAVITLVVLVASGRRRAANVVAVLGYAGYVVADAVDPRAATGGSALRLAVVAGWLAVVLAVAELVRTRRAQAAERATAAAEEEERRAAEQRLELARELHDVLAHHLSLINVQASVALHLLDEQPHQAGPALAHIKAASHDALGELRTALDLLRGGDEAPRAPTPGLADLPTLVAGVRAGGLDVQLDHDGVDDHPALPAAVELAAYRIVQEALTNVTRHARAGRATVRVRHHDGVDVEVLDDGVGPAGARGPAAGPGNGLVGMRERAGAVGGTVETGPRPAGGFRVAAHLPAVPT